MPHDNDFVDDARATSMMEFDGPYITVTISSKDNMSSFDDIVELIVDVASSTISSTKSLLCGIAFTEMDILLPSVVIE